MTENPTQADYRRVAREHFSSLQTGTSLPKIRTMALNMALDKIDPPLTTDADYKDLFGVTRGEFNAVVKPAAPRAM